MPTLKTLESEIVNLFKSSPSLTFLKSVAKDELGAAIDKAFAEIPKVDAAVEAEVNTFIAKVTSHFGAEATKVADGVVDSAITWAFNKLGSTATADTLKAEVFAHLGL